MSKKTKVSENDVLKALDALEGDVKKGKIPAEMKDADGGFATEGDGSVLQVSASENAEGAVKKSKGAGEAFKKAKKKKVKKAPPMDTSSSSSSESSPDEEGSPDDDMSSSSPDAMSKAVQSSSSSSSDSDSMSKATSASDMSSSESSSGEGEVSKAKAKKSKKAPSMKKSLREVADDNDDLKKAMDISPFLEGLVDQLSDALGETRKSMTKRFTEIGERDDLVKKALIAIGKEVVSQGEMIKSLVERLEEVPSASRSRKSVLNKSDIVEKSFQKGEGSDQIDHRDPKVKVKVLNWLLNKAEKGEIAAPLVSQYESGFGIPGDLLKAAEHDLFNKAD